MYLKLTKEQINYNIVFSFIQFKIYIKQLMN